MSILELKLFTMKTLEINKSSKTKSASGAHFLMLGSQSVPVPSMKGVIKEKIDKKTSDAIPGIWATIGNANDEQIYWSGKLGFSENGNDDSFGSTLQEVQLLKEIHQEDILKSGKGVMERFINFDNIDFKLPETFSTEDIPKLRLTVFLAEDEGALVFYELYETQFSKHEESEVEYIQPEKTDQSFSTKRDRLTYLFDAKLIHDFAPSEKKGFFNLFKSRKTRSFILKILTFPRDNSKENATPILTSILEKFIPSKHYRLLYYHPSDNKFIQTKQHGNTVFTINSTLKTLLLLHGTFVDTEKSFAGMISKEPGKKSWLQELIVKGKYQQVIAFDHPTISEDAIQNKNALISELDGIRFSKNNPVSIITTSRGGLVGKAIMGDAEMQNNIMPIDKAILIACGNGCHYFNAAEHIAKFLSIMRSFAKILDLGFFLKAIIAFAEFSTEYFLSRAGCKQMTMGDDKLKHILNLKPQLPSTSIYAISDDWDKQLVDEAKIIRRWVMSKSDLLIKQKVFKGLEHDWVIAVKNQQIMPEGFLKELIKTQSSHTKILLKDKSNPDIKNKVWDILHL